MNSVLHILTTSTLVLVGVALVFAGLIVSTFSSWSARDNWKADLALWLLGAVFLVVLGLTFIIFSKGIC